jgi:hypothetical protein
VLVATFSTGLLLAAKAGYAGIPLGFLLLSWFFKYCFVVLDSIIAGAEEPPVLSLEMVNPVSEQRPLVVGLLLVAEGMLVAAIQKYLGSLAGLGAVVILASALPANIAVLGIQRHPFQFISPSALYTVVRTLGTDYVIVNLVTQAVTWIAYAMILRGAPLWVSITGEQLLFLLVFSLIGGAVFEHRFALGIESKTRGERLAERAAREHEAERSRMLDHAHASFRVSKPLEGWKEIEGWLARHGQGENQGAEYRALLRATAKWEDVRPGDRLANDLAAALLARRATGAALAVVEQRLADNPRFKVSSPANAARLAELAGAAGKRALQRRIADE